VFWWYLAAALLTGCGRFAFDEHAVDGALADTSDASPVTVCSPGAAPSSLKIAGQTFQYTNFDNTSAVVDTVMVHETFATNSQTTVSDANGNYIFGITTGGNPGVLTMDISRMNFFTTHISTDTLIAADQIGTRGMVWRIGDAPIWNSGAMDSVYANAVVPYSAQLGTLNVAVRDCAGAPVAGVTVTLTPPVDAMGKLFYQASDGTAANMSATAMPFTHAIALRVPAGMVTIHATGGGKTFADHTVLVMAGMNTSITVIHGQ